MDNRPIGVFDSGVGGLSIWRAIRRLLPQESLIFLADSGHVPYGEKSTAELHDLTGRIARFLLSQDVKIIVVACNTATVHAIGYLRENFPETPFVGVVPVVKTLARRTRTGTIAVLSTPATAQSPYLAGLIEEFAPGQARHQRWLRRAGEHGRSGRGGNARDDGVAGTAPGIGAGQRGGCRWPWLHALSVPARAHQANAGRRRAAVRSIAAGRAPNARGASGAGRAGARTRGRSTASTRRATRRFSPGWRAACCEGRCAKSNTSRYSSQFSVVSLSVS